MINDQNGPRMTVICYGDSNTYGYDPRGYFGGRYDADCRWVDILATETGWTFYNMGQNGREIPSADPDFPADTDLLIVMLGTNDTKERLGVNAACIALGMERLLRKAKSVPAWRDAPRILVVAPPPIGEGLYRCPEGAPMGRGCPQKSRELAGFLRPVAAAEGCAFLDAAGIGEFNSLDCMHLTRRGHRALAAALAARVPELL